MPLNTIIILIFLRLRNSILIIISIVNVNRNWMLHQDNSLKEAKHVKLMTQSNIAYTRYICELQNNFRGVVGKIFFNTFNLKSLRNNLCILKILISNERV